MTQTSILLILKLFPHLYPGSSVVLDFIDSWSLPFSYFKTFEIGTFHFIAIWNYINSIRWKHDCMCFRKGADHLRSNGGDQHLFLLHRWYNTFTSVIHNVYPLAVNRGCNVGVCRTWSNFSHDAAHMTQGLAIRILYIFVLGRIKITCASAKHHQVSVVTGHTKGYESLPSQRFT